MRRALPAVLLVLGLAAAGCGQQDDHLPHHGAAKKYVALGDSYSSAPRTGKTSGPAVCKQSAVNYPHLLAKKLDLDLDDVTCAGASTDHMTEPQELGAQSVPPQLDAVDSDTRLVTLGIGANDENEFAKLIGFCGRMSQSDPTGSPCTDAVHDPDKLLAGWEKRTSARIVRVIRAIAERAPDAKVLVIGYPEIIPQSKGCPELPIATGDIPFAHQAIDAFTAALRSAAETTKVTFVDLSTVTEGHDICGSPPWIAGLRPTAPAAPFHPYAAEQSAVADVIADVVDGK